MDEPKSPLYGRHYIPIHLDRLNRASSIDFLNKGFEYHGIKQYGGLAEKAVDEFDGIIGWLTYFGAEAVRLYSEGVTLTPEKLAETVKSKAVQLCAEELGKLSSRSRLYIGILSALKPEGTTWSDIRLSLEKTFKRTVSKQQLAVMLRNLEDLSYIKKENGF
ncbi:MAG: ATP-binding protein [Nitrososphaerota archaeon]